jgi:HEPN domain-containing protein
MRPHEEWLAIASTDLKTAKKLIGGNDPVFNTAIYHAQQCAEKALKAYLSFKQNPIVKTHDLGELVELCIPFNEGFSDLMDDADILTPYNILYRYPPFITVADEEDVKGAIEKAEKIFNFVKDQIQRESQ